MVFLDMSKGVRATWRSSSEKFVCLALFVQVANVACSSTQQTRSVAHVRHEVCPTRAFPSEGGTIGQHGAFTVREASCALHDKKFQHFFGEKQVSITGYITATNLSDAPKCAFHRPGMSDLEGCQSRIPAFWLGDAQGTPKGESIRVVGWASQYAQVFSSMALYAQEGPTATDFDIFWGVPIPNPIPAVGAKATVTGRYGTLPAESSRGTDPDPTMGILTYSSLKTLKFAPSPAVPPKR